MDKANTTNLIAALGNDNLFWRQTAQRLLVQQDRQDAVPSLRNLVKEGGNPAIHALWALDGLSQLDPETHQLALLSPDSALKRNAIKALGTGKEAEQRFYDTAVVADKDPQVRLAAFAKLASFPQSETRSRAASQLIQDPENRSDEWLALALKTAGGNQAIVERYEFGDNLLTNPSFEETVNGEPKGWQVRNYKGEANYSMNEDPADARTGKHSMRIGSKEGADSSWFSHVTLKPDTEYRLSGWIKTEGVLGGHGALLNVHELQHEAKTNSLIRNNDWTRVEKFFNSGKHTKVTVNLLLGGWGTARGSAFYDDVALQEVTPVFREESTQLTGDAARGKKLFQEHQVAACIRCHQLGGEGGPIGPPLDGIASRKSPEYLRESLVDPQAAIAEGFQAGISPMPPMKVLLSEQEFEDIMAYLLSLE